MADVKNIIVGAAELFVSPSGSGRTQDPAFGTGAAAATAVGSDLLASANKFTNVGYTSEGVEISYEPDYGEVTVDQLLDAARLFKQGLRVSVRTSMVEGTLDNMNIAFGQASTALTSNGSTLNIAAGALGDAPAERTIVFVGQAPTSGTAKERVYVARRVVQVETVAHSLRRTEATMFPVNFRCLPSDAYSGSEYGKVVDRSW